MDKFIDFFKRCFRKKTKIDEVVQDITDIADKVEELVKDITDVIQPSSSRESLPESPQSRE